MGKFFTSNELLFSAFLLLVYKKPKEALETLKWSSDRVV